jgi:two-component system sensor histidine kinase KdpD
VIGIEDTLMSGLYFIIALTTGTLRARLRAQEQAVREREKRTAALYKLSRAIASAPMMEDVLRNAVQQIGQVFDAEVAFLLREEENRLPYVPHSASTLAVDEKERSVATWAFLHRRPAGRFTDTLPMADARWIPLITPNGVVGVMGVRSRSPGRLTVEHEILLETSASQVALAVEREMLDEAAERAAIVTKSEHLYRTLLDAVSNELRTPITTITEAAASLGDSERLSQAGPRIEEIRLAADRLNHLVENLLDMTRLESGMLKPQLDWCDVDDLIQGTLRRLQPYLAPHDVLVTIAPNLPLVRVDRALLEQVLHNLIHNSATHTPPGTRVRVSAQVDQADLVITVADRGPGMPPETLPKIFDKYYRAEDAQRGGVGLGLSITRGLIEAQGGTIVAENRTRGGISFIIRFPLSEHPPAIGATKAAA